MCNRNLTEGILITIYEISKKKKCSEFMEFIAVTRPFITSLGNKIWCFEVRLNPRREFHKSRLHKF